MLLAAIPTPPLPTPETANGERRLAGISGKTIGFELNDQNRLIFRSLVEGLDTEDLLQLKSPLREVRAV